MKVGDLVRHDSERAGEALMDEGTVGVILQVALVPEHSGFRFSVGGMVWVWWLGWGRAWVYPESLQLINGGLNS